MLYPVCTNEVPRVWPVLEKYREKVFSRSPIPVNDAKIYEAVMSGTVKLFLMCEGPTLQGMMLLKVEDHFGVSVLNVYAMAHENGYSRYETDLKELDALATALGCEYLLGYGRRGFSKTMPARGFKPVQVVMAKKVGE